MEAALIHLRPAAADDAAALAWLSGQFGYPTGENEIRERLERIGPDENHRVWVAETIEATVVGWLHAFRQTHMESGVTVEIGGLVVDARWRACGVGRRLVEEAERWAAVIGCRRIIVRSNITRADAHAFYEKLGYLRSKSQHVFGKSL